MLAPGEPLEFFLDGTQEHFPTRDGNWNRAGYLHHGDIVVVLKPYATDAENWYFCLTSRFGPVWVCKLNLRRFFR